MKSKFNVLLLVPALLLACSQESTPVTPFDAEPSGAIDATVDAAPSQDGAGPSVDAPSTDTAEAARPSGSIAMVVSAHPAASRVGADVLLRGGSAVDAAIATQLALNVAEPQNSGLGGGGFLMFYEKASGKVTIVDGRERAPQSATAKMFLGPDGITPIPFSKRVTDGRAVAVPGTPRVIATAHQRWGKLPFAQLVDPAIDLAEKGVAVNFVLAADIAKHKDKLLLDRDSASVFVPHGVPLREGDRLVQPGLGRALRAMRDGDTSTFYVGAIADALRRAVNARGGSMTASDLASYTLTIDAPIRSAWHGFDVAAMPPPSSGGVATLQILKILDHESVGSYQVRSTTRYQLLAEAMRLAFADREAYVGDPEFVSVPVAGMLDDAYLASRAALIRPNARMTSVLPGSPAGAPPAAPPPTGESVGEHETEGGDTTHLAVADGEGNIVAWTTTIEQAFGTGIMVPDYGYLLNNQVTDFEATGIGPNRADGRKRPMSSMSPTILFQGGRPVLALGASGGARIIAAVSQVLENVYDHGLSLRAAIDEPRIFAPNIGAEPSRISWQDTSSWIPGGAAVPAEARAGLAALGHVVDKTPAERGWLGVAQAIVFDGDLVGVPDRQREGTAIRVEIPPSP